MKVVGVLRFFFSLLFFGCTVNCKPRMPSRLGSMAKIIVLQCNADLGLVSTLEHTDLNKTVIKVIMFRSGVLVFVLQIILNRYLEQWCHYLAMRNTFFS